MSSAWLHFSVSWPKVSEGGKVVGKEEVRAYWTRQWAAFDPHVAPLETIDLGGGKLEFRVHQLVKNLQGDVLSDSEVRHVFSVKNGLIKSMDLKGEGRLIFWPVRCVCEIALLIAIRPSRSTRTVRGISLRWH